VQFVYQDLTLMSSVMGEDPLPDMIFLHGWKQDRNSLSGLAALFTNTHRVHLIDLPGFGESTLPKTAWGVGDYKEIISEYIKEHTKGSAIIVGHSFGGRIAVVLASRNPEQVDGLVLLAAAGLLKKRSIAQRIRGSYVSALRKVFRLLEPVTGHSFIEWHNNKFGSRDYKNAGALKDIFIKTIKEDLTKDAIRITQRTLLLWGVEDVETPVEIAYRYKQLIKGESVLKIFPHKDHMLFLDTGAHLCAEKIREWL